MLQQSSRAPQPGAPAGTGSARVCARLQWQTGACRSLRFLGLFSQMRDSAISALHATRADLAAERLGRLQLTSCALQAAWRLRDWQSVHSLLADPCVPTSDEQQLPAQATSRDLPRSRAISPTRSTR